jgi:ribokinase
MHLAIIGNLNLDIKTAPIAGAEQLLDDGETSVEEIYESIGGGGALTALAAAKLGADVSLCAAVGNDSLGIRVQTVLERAGIRHRLVHVGAPTGKSIALNLENGHRHFVSSLPSAALLEVMDIDVAGLCDLKCDHLYRADIWFAPRMLDHGNFEILQAARERGIETSIDINWDPHWADGREDSEVCDRIAAVQKLLPLADYVHGNERELGFFAEREDVRTTAAWFFENGAKHLIVHRGRHGSMAISSAGHLVEAAPIKVERPVHFAGAGDVFTAAFLSCDIADLSVKLACANRAAADHCAGVVEFFPRF